MDQLIRREIAANFDKLDLEAAVLMLLQQSEEPLGAVMITLELEPYINVSQATVSRKLTELDKRGLTKRVGYRGRRLTEQGLKHLQKALDSKSIMIRGKALLTTLSEDSVETLIQVLEARRALEKEIVGLACVRMDDVDFDELDRLLSSHEQALAHGEYGTPEDLEFHEAVARFSKNQVLLLALRLVRGRAQLSQELSEIRRKVGSTLVLEHRNILDAMRTRRPHAASQAMEHHINQVIRDVHNFYGMRFSDELVNLQHERDS